MFSVVSQYFLWKSYNVNLGYKRWDKALRRFPIIYQLSCIQRRRFQRSTSCLIQCPIQHPIQRPIHELVLRLRWGDAFGNVCSFDHYLLVRACVFPSQTYLYLIQMWVVLYQTPPYLRPYSAIMVQESLPYFMKTVLGGIQLSLAPIL